MERRTQTPDGNKTRKGLVLLHGRSRQNKRALLECPCFSQRVRAQKVLILEEGFSARLVGTTCDETFEEYFCDLFEHFEVRAAVDVASVVVA